MEKKTINVHAVTVHIYTIAIALLVLLLLVLGFKYTHLKWSVNKYTQSTMWMNQQDKPTGQVSDYALIIGKASQSMASNDLQNFVVSISKDLNRDIVVVDKNQKILADTVSQNKDTTYSYSQKDEVNMTIEDGKTRAFEEKSNDYPNGIMEIVVPVKNIKGDILGAVMISKDKLSH